MKFCANLKLVSAYVTTKSTKWECVRGWQKVGKVEIEDCGGLCAEEGHESLVKSLHFMLRVREELIILK